MTINPNNTTAACSGGDDWRDDPSADERWNAGCDFALEQLGTYLGIDLSSITWDGATETVEGDVNAVIGNILRAKMGEDWDPHAPAVAAPQASAPRSASAGDGVREALESAADWCQMEGDKLGAIDGYDYRSGEEFGLRKAQIELRKRAKALASNPLEGKGIQSTTEQASSGLRSPEHGEG